MTELSIEDNVRNTQAICRALLVHYRGDVPIQARGPEGRAVEFIAYKDSAELIRQLTKVIRRLTTTERFDNRDIVVLTPHVSSDKSELLAAALAERNNLASEPPAIRGETVYCTSIENFKGLERKVAIVAELDRNLPSEERLRQALLYVALSRPRNHLILLGQKETLESIRNQP